MKTVAIESLRRHLGSIRKSEEPVLVTRYGKLAGVFYPLPEEKKVAAKARAAFEPEGGAPRRRRKLDPQLPLIKGE